MAPATVAENGEVVRAAAQALGLLGDPEARWALMDLAEMRTEPVLVSAAAEAIARIGTETAAMFLGELALHEDPAKRAAAAGGLQFLDDPETPELLWSLLRDDDPQVRARAAASLGRRPPGEVWAGLREAVCDDREDLRAGALAALRGQVDRGALSADDVEALAGWAQAGASAPPLPGGCLAPLAEEAARARSRLEQRERQALAPPPAPAQPPRPSRVLAAEIGLDGIPVYRPVRHAIIGEDERLSAGTGSSL